MITRKKRPVGNFPTGITKFSRKGRDGAYGSKGYTPYNTRTLVEKVTARMDSMEAAGRGRICPINGRWMLQIRGKDLRRLKKSMPGLVQKGRYLYQE